MSSEINVNISKILNWTLTNSNTKLQIAFHTLKSHSYLAHKTVVGYYNMQTIILNTSFKINYSPSDHIIICQITDIHDKNHHISIGEIKIDLNTLMDRTILFLPFEDHDKVLQVKIYQNPKQKHLQSQNYHLQDQESQNQRQAFLQERYNFLDKINQHQAHLKKKFSEKVYNLLKELKSKNYDNRSENKHGQNHSQNDLKHKKNEIQFLNRLGESKKKVESKFDGNSNNKPDKKTRLSPIRNKYDDLLIHSMHTKTDFDYSAQTSKRQIDIITKNELKQIEQEIKALRVDNKGANIDSGYNVKNPYALLNKINDY